MSQGVVIALLVLAGLVVLRVTNLPPFSGSSAQSPTPTQTLPTPLTRSTGYSTGVATAAENLSPPSTTQPSSTSTGGSTGSGSSTTTGTTQQPPIPGRW